MPLATPHPLCAFLRAAAPEHDFELVPYDVVHKTEYPTDDQLRTFDALTYTGSGICFGHQIIARVLGGSCVRNDRWEIGPTSLDLTTLGKSVFGVDTLVRSSFTYSACLIPHQKIQQMHRDHAPTLPPSFDLLASSPTSPIQGSVRSFPSSPHNLPNIHIFSVQGHPESTESIVSHLVSTRAQSGIITPDVASDYETRRDWQNDGVSIVGKAVWRVLGVGTQVD
ncbi:hypothetical protein C0993_011261 [Termitomyces sp. T159_Od127]|nr:hypothetical protein C0993_011261 [Termitomyces sp. T159_Od127]